MFKKFFNPKVIKFLLGGALAAAINLLLIYWLIDILHFNTPFLRNLANLISIEISLLASFFIYRMWVWTGGSWQFKDVLLKQLPLYHVAAGSAVLVRVLLIFPALDWLKVSYTLNTLVGVAVSASINYLLSDKLVFKKNQDSDIYRPESLETVLSQEPRLHYISDNYHIDCLSLVIPAYNEEGCIVSTVELITDLLDQEKIKYEILVVNDNSKDNTESLLQQLHQANPKVRYINNYYPNGFGFAVRCGLENFTGDAVAIVMADNSDSPQNILDYYYKLQEGYDCVFGSRFIRGGKVVDYPTYKLIINRMANLFIQVMFGLPFNDITNAFKIYRREVIEGITPLISHHFNLTVEMPLKAIVRNYSYASVPITWQNRKTGISKLKLREMGSRYLFVVLSLWLEKHLSRGDYQRKIVTPAMVYDKSLNDND